MSQGKLNRRIVLKLKDMNTVLNYRQHSGYVETFECTLCLFFNDVYRRTKEVFTQPKTHRQLDHQPSGWENQATYVEVVAYHSCHSFEENVLKL